MEKTLYNKKSFNLYNINPLNFKESRIEFNFRNNVTKDNYLYALFLSEILCCTSKNLHKRVDFYKRSEELYNARVFGNTSKIGNTLITTISLNFLNPNYTYDDDYLENVIKYLTDCIFNPVILNGGLDENSFNVVKHSLISDIMTIDENPTRVTMKNMFNMFDENSNIRIFSDNYSIDDINSVTREKLYKFYLGFLEHFYCDVIVVGDLDFDKVNKILCDNIPLKVIKNHNVELYYQNRFSNKILKKEDESSFNQSTFSLLFELKDLSIREKYYTINLFDYIFCNGSFKSKLFKKLREEHSLCYGVSSFYMKFDSLYGITSSLTYKNIKLAKKLVTEAFYEMQNGDFSDEILSEAKKSMVDYLKSSGDSIISYCGQGLLEIIDDFPSVEERIRSFNDITKDEIIEITKKINLKIEYILKGDCHEKN